MRPLTEFRGLYPDIHHQKIAEHFKHDAKTFEAGQHALAEALHALKGFFVVCFTNRCGSNFLAQAIASEGRLPQAGEVLNFDTVTYQAAKFKLPSYPAFLAHLVPRVAGKNKIFGCKASVGQLLSLYNLGVLHHVKDKLTLIHVQRQSHVDQAISMYIASRTRKWTSTQEGVDAEIDYEPDELLSILENICRQNAAFQSLFELLQVDAVPVQYERLVEEPLKVVRRVGRRMGLQNLRYVAEKVTYEKQADATNQALKERWLGDFRVGTGTGSGAADDD
jgi:LPS sulfotransferase NodH